GKHARIGADTVKQLENPDRLQGIAQRRKIIEAERVNDPRGAVVIVDSELEQRETMSGIARMVDTQLHELSVNSKHSSLAQRVGKLAQIRWTLNVKPTSPLRGHHWRRARPTIARVNIGRSPALGHPDPTFHPADTMLQPRPVRAHDPTSHPAGVHHLLRHWHIPFSVYETPAENRKSNAH